MNIGIITISNWGVGDELALLGTNIILDKVFHGANKFYIDKNFEIKFKDSITPLYSDIYTSEFKDDIKLDLVVSAGGNNWSGPAYCFNEEKDISYTSSKFHNYIAENSIPNIYLGVGMSGDYENDLYIKDILKNNLLFIGRDHVACNLAESLGAKNVHKLCCPSLFIDKPDCVVKNRIGLVYQPNSDIAPHSCKDEEIYRDQITLFRRLSKEHDTKIFCHYIRDYVDACDKLSEFKDRIFYSKVLNDYIDGYNRCNLIISMRLHGAYLGVTLHKPTISIKKGVGKMCAMGQIGVPNKDPKDLIDLSKTDLKEIASTGSKGIKSAFYKKYTNLLKKVKGSL